MENKNNGIREEELFDVSREYLCLYGVNINLQRSIPMVVDGLKPVFRRILYAVYKNYRTNKVTVASAIGDTLKYHPHGDLGLRDVIAGLAQPFSNNIPLLDAIGNCGTPTAGDDAAASRYWSIKLSQFALDVLFDEYDGKVNMKPSYDDTSIEPIAFPAKFPIILLNGSSGIGYTLSSDIYPYNLTEVANATIKLLKNPKANIKLVPDLPTGCDIIVRDEETFIMQSSFDVDNVNYVITIKNTPYKRYLKDIHAKLCAIQDSPNPIPEIISADNESDLIKGEIRYVIRCKPCNLYNVINTLFKRVPGLRVGISTRNMLVVNSQFRTSKYTIRQILLSWIDERIKGKRTWFLRKMVSLTSECNMLEGKAFMLSDKNLNKTIKIFHECKQKADIIPALVKAYSPNVTSSQANYMIDVKMYQLTHEEYEKTLKKIDEIQTEIAYVKDVVENPDKIRDVIINELETIKTKYGFSRRSKILNIGDDGDNVNIGVVQILPNGSFILAETDNPEQLSSDVIPVSGDQVCLVDEYGNFIWVDTNKTPHDTPLTLTSIGKTQMGNCIAAVSNLSNEIIILSNKGRIKYMPINRIPTNATKKPLLPLDDDEHIVSILEIHDQSMDLLAYTSDGLGKRFQVSDLNKVLSVDAQGQFIIKDQPEVAGMFAINPKKPLLVYVTRLGRIRVNQSKFLSAGKKFGGMRSIIKLTPQDDLIAVFCADESNDVVLNHVDGRVTTVHINTIDPTTMSMPPVRPKHVPSTRVLRATLS